MIALEVIVAGPLTTVQDLGRHGHGSIGVGTSGALDHGSAAEANRLVGNLSSAALLEVTMGQLVVRARRRLDVAVAGAHAGTTVDGILVGHRSRFNIPAGATLSLGTPSDGTRTYVAVRGGIAVDPVLGSRSTDTLSGLGPLIIVDGDLLESGHDVDDHPAIDFVPHRTGPRAVPVVRYRLGPRHDWFTAAALRLLHTSDWRVSPDSNRIGTRLLGPALERACAHELPSEGVVLGSIQVPPSGPIIFMNDHPVTGGYPVIGVVHRPDLDAVAQARPGQVLRLLPHDLKVR